MRHFEFTGETKTYKGRTLHRIRCISGLDGVGIGDEGGWIESEDNLHDRAWVSGEAIVCDHARAYGKARVYNSAKVYGNVWVHGNAEVYDNAKVYGNAEVYDNAKVYGNAWVYDNAKVYDSVKVSGNAEVHGNAWVYGNAKVNLNARIKQDMDYCVFQGFGSASRTTTAFRTADEGTGVTCGCFSGTLHQFEERVKDTHGENRHGLEYMAIINLIKLHFNV